ncbi:hypothetical protein [Pseudohongiella acticola]|jgi:hypothetical protein|uniref:hypothetical protein n=1 Tax=Pseudohongiella acticola TaxID=1524254 RepID=UPI001471F3DA|nr:hypothetical protein [Pseudohongiella acticola]|tara:strand:- start:489 stop:641 length:153 start_codon:yes stop_codon:yes gene_type:complete
MRLFKRSINPIFIEDEGYNWGNKRGKGFKVFMFLLTLTLAAGVFITMVNA